MLGAVSTRGLARPGALRRPVPADGRRYAGRSEAERRADRRARLLAAGLDLFGTLGWGGGTVERLCAAAGVATRSFYEEFPQREALLLAVYSALVDGAAAAVQEAVATCPLELAPRVERGIAAYVTYLTEDPRRARVVHVQVRAAGSELEPQRRAAVAGFAALIEVQGQLLAGAGQRRAQVTPLTALALAGAANELLVHWATSDPAPDTSEIIAELSDLFHRVLSPGVRQTGNG